MTSQGSLPHLCIGTARLGGSAGCGEGVLNQKTLWSAEQQQLPVCGATELHGGVFIVVLNVSWPHRLRLLGMDLDLHLYREGTLCLTHLVKTGSECGWLKTWFCKPRLDTPSWLWAKGTTFVQGRYVTTMLTTRASACSLEQGWEPQTEPQTPL